MKNIKDMVSVIIPVYNAEKYLHRCIDSILAQTYTDFELLLINDGSNDGSGMICDAYAAKDSRVRVFHKENGGVSSARNTGLDYATGEWITFVDSDDWMENNSLESLIQHKSADLIIGAISYEYSGNGDCSPILGDFKGDELYHVVAENIDHYSMCSSYAKLFRRSIIETNFLRFNEELCFGEDSLFVKNYLFKINRIVGINTLVYHYQDIGTDIFTKYSKSFLPIMKYYYKMLEIYDKFESLKDVSISRKGIVKIVYSLAKTCLVRNGAKDLSYICQFMKDKYVQEELCKIKTINIKIQLLLSKFPLGYMLLLYVKIVERIKSIIYHI